MKHLDYIAQLESDLEYQAELAELKTHFALGDAIIHARINKGLSQTELAELVGTKQANISRIEAALGNPTLKLINKILRALDLDMKFVAPNSTTSYKTIAKSINYQQPGIPVNNWPTRANINSSSSQITGKLSK